MSRVGQGGLARSSQPCDHNGADHNGEDNYGAQAELKTSHWPFPSSVAGWWPSRMNELQALVLT